jgi:hypothetical protein
MNCGGSVSGLAENELSQSLYLDLNQSSLYKNAFIWLRKVLQDQRFYFKHDHSQLGKT